MERRRHTVAAAVAGVVLLAVGGCGGGAGQPSTPDSRAASVPASVSSPSPTARAVRTLDEPALTAALLQVTDMPTGYSEDPDQTPPKDKTFCNYQQPHTPTVQARRLFIKGGGLSAEVASVGLRQYADAAQAAAVFDALVTAMQTCKGEKMDGKQNTYAVMSMPKVGDKTIGIRIDVDGATVLQGFALSGPMLVSAGVGGLMNVSGDVAADLLTKQVGRYTDAAKG
ncbi:hypothetical protein GCM10027610_071770 [Dactylosporangium cerinum]